MTSVATGIDRETLTSFLATRHSVRAFQDRELTPEVVQDLVATAAFIPSGGNRHGHRFTVIPKNQTRALLMEEVTKIYRRRSRLLNSRILRIVARPFVGQVQREFLKDATYGPVIRALVRKLTNGEDPVFYGAPAAVAIHSPFTVPTPKEDSVIAGFALVLAAHAMGLGACFVTLGQSAINASARCKAILGIPQKDVIYAVVVVGYPAKPNGEPSHRTPRETRYA